MRVGRLISRSLFHSFLVPCCLLPRGPLLEVSRTVGEGDEANEKAYPPTDLSPFAAPTPPPYPLYPSPRHSFEESHRMKSRTRESRNYFGTPREKERGERARGEETRRKKAKERRKDHRVPEDTQEGPNFGRNSRSRNEPNSFHRLERTFFFRENKAKTKKSFHVSWKV